MMTITEQEKLDLETAAHDAERLRTDPAFQRALMAMRKEAVETLIATDAASVDAIREAQAQVKAIDSLCGQIATAIQRGTQITRKPAAVA
jgi:hypothetical protein